MLSVRGISEPQPYNQGFATDDSLELLFVSHPPQVRCLLTELLLRETPR